MKTQRLLLALFVLITSIGTALAQTQLATGTVFNDTNRNGVLDDSETGIPGIGVSNGRDIITTDSNGRYALTVSDDSIIFVIKPSNWTTQFDSNNLPKFYYINKPNGSPKLKYKGISPTGPLPESIDFPLYPSVEPNTFKALVIADPQTRDQTQVNYLAHDFVEEVVGTDAAFGISLGDIASDNLNIYSSSVPVMGRIGVPWYNVKGNHDSNYDLATDTKMTSETFKSVFGPTYYSFNYGPVHFIALNNVYFMDKNNYLAKLDDDQMTFLRNDLQLVPQNQLVVIMTHIPFMYMVDRPIIYALLQNRPNTFWLSGHTHNQTYQFHNAKTGFLGQNPIVNLINITACGDWWDGLLDEVGIPFAMATDGTPNGYSIITFNASSYSVRYKAMRKPVDYQMNIFAPDIVKSQDLEKTEVIANIFAGSEKSTVEMSIDNTTWSPMKRTYQEDPYYVQLRKYEEKCAPVRGRSNQKPSKTGHIWKLNLPSGLPIGTHLIHIRTTDMYGQTYQAYRVFNVTS